MSQDFMECKTCKAKPGTPVLCPSCLANRSTIERLRAVVDKLPKCWRLDESDKPVRDAPVVPQMRVWRLDWQTTLGETVVEVRTDQVRLDGIPRMYSDTELANTPEAAEAARKEGGS